MKKFLTAYFLLSASYFAVAQNNLIWQGKKCAVVLTYDDGLNIDLTNVIPALNSLGLKGTFYISDYFNGLNAQIFKWRNAAVMDMNSLTIQYFIPAKVAAPVENLYNLIMT